MCVCELRFQVTRLGKTDTLLFNSFVEQLLAHAVVTAVLNTQMNKAI